MTQDNAIVLHVYGDMLEAKMIQDLLKEHGIDSFLNDENVLGMDPIGGTELRILEKDREAAEKVMALQN